MSRNVTKTEALAVQIAAGVSIADGARQVGYSARHASRIAAQREFGRRVRELRQELTHRTVGRLVSDGLSAAATLAELLVSPSHAVRLSTARTILELGGRLRELGDLETRLADREQRVEHMPGAARLSIRSGGTAT